jgi:hypothetical protein
MVVKLNALLYELFGKEANLTQKEGGYRRIKSVTGKDYEVPLLGKLRAPTGIADGSAEVAAATVTHVGDTYGAAEFKIAHYGHVEPIPESEFDRFRGDEAKTASYIDELYDMLMWSYENVYGDAIHADVAPSRTALGGWRYAVDDANAYGTVNRADAANADFRGIVAGTFGAVTLTKLQAQQNAVRKNNGHVKIGVTGETLFAKIQDLVQPYSEVTYSEDVAKFGAPNVAFAGVKYILDHRTASGVIGLLDPRWWDLVALRAPFTETGLVKDITRRSTYVIHTTQWVQLVCRKPNANVKITGATA